MFLNYKHVFWVKCVYYEFFSSYLFVKFWFALIFNMCFFFWILCKMNIHLKHICLFQLMTKEVGKVLKSWKRVVMCSHFSIVFLIHYPAHLKDQTHLFVILCRVKSLAGITKSILRKNLSVSSRIMILGLNSLWTEKWIQ